MALIIAIKDTATLGEKFAKRAQAAGPEYKSGVLSNTTQNEAAKAAGDRWLAGVTAAGVAKFEKGLNRAGQEKYVRKASTTGADRYPQGAFAAKPDWISGVEPIFTALRGFNPGPRGLRRSPQNISRVQNVITQIEKAADARP